jgi:hypothetical protein
LTIRESHSAITVGKLLADMLLEMRRPNEALTEYNAVLAVAPNRRNALAGKTRAQR